MRDYCLNEASSRAAYGRLTWVVRLVHNWRMRKTLKQLSKLADYQLRDIGLPRNVLQQLIGFPLATDIVWEMQRGHLLEQRYGRETPIAASPCLPSKANSALPPTTSPQMEFSKSPGL